MWDLFTPLSKPFHEIIFRIHVNQDEYVNIKNFYDEEDEYVNIENLYDEHECVNIKNLYDEERDLIASLSCLTCNSTIRTSCGDLGLYVVA
jgi:hypothetical protein